MEKIKFTTKQLRFMVANKFATDLTKTSEEHLPKNLLLIGYSEGKCGITGLLLKDKHDKIYIIIGRIPQMFHYIH